MRSWIVGASFPSMEAMALPAARTQVTSDLTGVWVGEEEEPQSNPDEHLQHRTTPLLLFKDPLDLVGGKFSPRFWCGDVVANEGVTPFEHRDLGKWRVSEVRSNFRSNSNGNTGVFGDVQTMFKRL